MSVKPFSHTTDKSVSETLLTQHWQKCSWSPTYIAFFQLSEVGHLISIIPVLSSQHGWHTMPSGLTSEYGKQALIISPHCVTCNSGWYCFLMLVYVLRAAGSWSVPYFPHLLSELVYYIVFIKLTSAGVSRCFNTVPN